MEWAEICYHLSQSIYSYINEILFEQKVLKVLEKMGWDEYKGEIKLKPKIPIGSQKYIQPDIVLYDRDTPVVVVEVKKPIENLHITQSV